MKYIEFRDAIGKALRKRRSGMTWAALRDALRLPYERPCPNWTEKLKREIGLVHERGEGRAHVWKIGR